MLLKTTLLLVISVGASATVLAAGAPRFEVNEAAIRMRLDSGEQVITIPVRNSSSTAVPAVVTAQIQGPRDEVLDAQEAKQEIPAGWSTLTISTAAKLDRIAGAKTAWLKLYRLRYSVSAIGAPSRGEPSAQGIQSLFQIVAQPFDLQIFAPNLTLAGQPYNIRTRAADPATGVPSPGVKIEASLRLDEHRNPTRRDAVTNDLGYATFEFDIPPGAAASPAQLTVTGERAGLIRQIESDINIFRGAVVVITTDKPIYQPGQVVHARVMIFDSNRIAVRGETATLSVEDPDRTTVFSSKVTTSSYGIASCDWAVPSDERLGEYRISVRMDSDSYEDAGGSQPIKIGRYDLPAFTVRARPDRAYYLPGQAADVDITVDYLFGRPVKNGRVRVVRQESRKWNYREQSWETEESDPIEGACGDDGKFKAHIDLAAAHRSLADSHYRRFEDISYAAYVTDPSTGRTERRRFDLRITSDSIHIYCISKHENSANSPLQFYVSTSYADGTPASCRVAIGIPERGATGPAKGTGRTLRTVATDRFGVAKVQDLEIPEPDSANRPLRLTLTAEDSQGRVGHWEQQFWLYREGFIRVLPDKTIHRPGESITAQVQSTMPGEIVVDLNRNSRVLRSTVISTKDGSGTVTFPYQEDFRGPLIVSAYSPASEDRPFGSAPVLYPEPEELKVELAASRATYRPGEEASVRFKTTGLGGTPVKSALGVTVIDKAVEERARIDEEDASSYGYYRRLESYWQENPRLGGYSAEDLKHMDPGAALAEGLDLLAEILFLNYSARPMDLAENEPDPDVRGEFSALLKAGMAGVKGALDSTYSQRREFPTGSKTLLEMLKRSRVDFESLRDPWGMPYVAAFTIRGDKQVLQIRSAGPDKQLGNRDDLVALEESWPYFRKTGEAIDHGIRLYHERTGGYIRNLAALTAALKRAEIDLASLRDPWGAPYNFTFDVSGKTFVVKVTSNGAKEQALDPGNSPSQKFEVWSSGIDYFASQWPLIDRALQKWAQSNGRFPRAESEYYEAIGRSKLRPEGLKDPWGHSYYLEFARGSDYSHKVTVEYKAAYGAKPGPDPEITPVATEFDIIQVASSGPDGVRGSADDFNVGVFVRGINTAPVEGATATVAAPAYLNGTGAVAGTVTDQNGAIIPNARIEAIAGASAAQFVTKADSTGKYFLTNLPEDEYKIRFQAPGFTDTVYSKVPVHSRQLTALKVALSVGTTSEHMTVTVTVSAEPLLMQTESASVSTTTDNGPRLPMYRPAPGEMTTPTIRQYFPETLLWTPELETDAAGNAEVRFKLADNITSWKVSTVASTRDGRVAIADTDIKSFQPFFVEFDPPRILTEGDEISLPVTIRNYLSSPQKVDLSLKRERWFEIDGPAGKQVSVDPDDSIRQSFAIRASFPVDSAKQRLSAIGPEMGDVIEKPVTVNPDGEEVVETTGIVIDSQTASDFEISGRSQAAGGTRTRATFEVPSQAIDGTAKAKIKIYPNLVSHLLEALEGIMHRPYGCAEQTISSAYPGLILLGYLRRYPEEVPPATERARSYIQLAYQRLLNYQEQSGGFSYWGHGDADLALTAYAIRFLRQAAEFITVDPSVVHAAEKWLVNQQRSDGSWPSTHQPAEEPRIANLSMTSFIAMALAEAVDLKPAGLDQNMALISRGSVERATAFLAGKISQSTDAYAVASFGWAALASGQWDKATKAIDRLRELARNRPEGLHYWDDGPGNPFNGWGMAGKLEATAMAVRVLHRRSQEFPASGSSEKAGVAATLPENRGNPVDRALVDGGLLFLLRNKDRYGIWYSSQTTQNVLDTLLAWSTAQVNERRVNTEGLEGSAQESSRSARESDGQLIGIKFNGQLAQQLHVSPDAKLANPLEVDLTRLLTKGTNTIEIVSSGSPYKMTAQVMSTYYRPWQFNPTAAADQNGMSSRSGSESGLRFTIAFDKTELTLGDDVMCTVEAARTDWSGAGMLIVEIGVPPGAEPDRESLDRAIRASSWEVSRYELQPDRVLVYLWPRSGAIKFQFKMRPRLAGQAQTGAFVLYDYYNPDARVVLRPLRFRVRDSDAMR